MAQVWLTYAELGELARCSAATARSRAIRAQWVRRRSRDGHTRVKLPPELAHHFMLAYAARFARPDSVAGVEALEHERPPLLSAPAPPAE